MTAILNEDPPPLPEAAGKVPVALERIVRHCLEKRPEDRFQSARDLVFDLEAVAQAGTADAPGWPPRRGRRMRLAMVAGVVVLGLLAVGGVVRNWFAHGIWNSRRTAPMSAVPLTSLSGWEGDPALSPDGSQLAFSWDGDGDERADIYVQLIGAGTPLRLTTDPADDRSPAWSPDGRHIAFLRSVSGGEQAIFTVPALGGPERKLQADCVARPCQWGEPRLVCRWKVPGVPGQDRRPTVSASSCSRSRRSRGAASPVPPEEHQADVVPAFSPDGRSVAFARVGGTTKPSVFVVPVAGGEPRRVSLGDVWTGGVPSGHTWTPDGSSIVASWSPGTGREQREPVEGPGHRRRPGAAGGRRGQRQPALHLPPGKPPGLRADTH